MGRRRSAALALACWLLAGCTFTPFPAETGALACTDALDDDGDDRVDCDDPDCWGFAHCRVPNDSGMATIPDPPVIEDPPLGPPIGPPHGDTDGSVPVDMPDPPDADVMIVPDATVDAETDAAAPPVCDESCPPGKCIDGVCSVPPLFGTFRLKSLLVLLPRATPENECYDAFAECLIGANPCCEPDPVVVVRVDGEKAGYVKEANAAYFTWQEPAPTLELHENAEVSFDVLDDDTTEVGDLLDADMPQGMFTCYATATVEAVASGLIKCKPDGYPAGLFTPDYRVEIAIERIDADPGADEAAGP